MGYLDVFGVCNLECMVNTRCMAHGAHPHLGGAQLERQPSIATGNSALGSWWKQRPGYRSEAPKNQQIAIHYNHL